jgi:hypothetical protein
MRLLAAPKHVTLPDPAGLTINHGPLGACVPVSVCSEVAPNLAELTLQRFGWEPTAVHVRVRPSLWAHVVTAPSSASANQDGGVGEHRRIRRLISTIALALTEPCGVGQDPAAELEGDARGCDGSALPGLVVQVRISAAPHRGGSALTLTAYAPALEVRS